MRRRGGAQQTKVAVENLKPKRPLSSPPPLVLVILLLMLVLLLYGAATVMVATYSSAAEAEAHLMAEAGFARQVD
jgi:hypothetical protein